jgi:hypothetical protein
MRVFLFHIVMPSYVLANRGTSIQATDHSPAQDAVLVRANIMHALVDLQVGIQVQKTWVTDGETQFAQNRNTDLPDSPTGGESAQESDAARGSELPVNAIFVVVPGQLRHHSLNDCNCRPVASADISRGCYVGCDLWNTVCDLWNIVVHKAHSHAIAPFSL